MLQRLTKVVEIDGKQCVACINYGTDECQLHKGGNDVGCAKCPVMGAMLNQLHAFEEIAFGKQKKFNFQK